MIQYGTPEAAGLSQGRLDVAYGLLGRWVEEGRVPGAATQVTRGGVWMPPRGFGRMAPAPDAAPLPPDAVFLVASVTKPLTCLAAVMLAERGLIALDQPVNEVVPEFRGRGKEEVRVIHLLTHTSGLPDMVPANLELRRRHAGLDEFIRHTCECDLLFRPGTSVSYQSMGIAMLGEIVRRVAGTPLPAFLDREVFGPLGMRDTSLGLKEGMRGRLATVRLPEGQEGTDWSWNTDYWLRLGAPWGGMLSTVKDITVVLRAFLNGGAFEGVRVIGTATARAMITNFVAAMPDIPEPVKLANAWGLGWRLGVPTSSGYFGDLVSPRMFGHGGATGTVVWADPDLDLTCAVFTTQPGIGRMLGLVSNAVAAAAV